MRRVCGSLLILAIVVFAASAAPAPEAPPLGGLSFEILRYSSRSQVREELKLSEDQVKKIEELRTEWSQVFRDSRGLNREDRIKKYADIIRKMEVKLPEILTRKQLRRAEQIVLQRNGPASFSNAFVATALKLTAEQKVKISLIMSVNSLKEYREMKSKGVPQTAATFRKWRDEKLLSVLTPAQKRKWKELLGEPFKLEPRRSEEQKQPGQGSDRPALPK